MAKLFGIFSLVAAVLCLVAIGTADDSKKNGKTDPDTFFKRLDTNSDGKLSREEFLKLADRVKDKDREKARERLAKVYEKLDTKRVGLSKDQFKAFLEARKNGDKQSPSSN